MNITDLVLISVGNTRTRVARAKLSPGTATPGSHTAGSHTAGSHTPGSHAVGASVSRSPDGTLGPKVHPAGDNALEPSRAALNSDPAGVVSMIRDACAGMNTDSTRVLVASVNPAGLETIERALDEVGPSRVRYTRLSVAGEPGLQGRFRSGELFVPMQMELPPPITVGVDRALTALAAFAKSGEACVVIDAGTAMTVSVVDGFGVFRGGAIAPGLTMMLRSLAAGTGALPDVLKFPLPPVPSEPVGTTTRDAMLIGCAEAARGLAHRAIDRFAVSNGAYPRVIATGGDAALLFEHDELVEHIVPDLLFIGMVAAWQIVMDTVDNPDDDDDADAASADRAADRAADADDDDDL
jgi:pantothenate kinase type III